MSKKLVAFAVSAGVQYLGRLTLCSGRGDVFTTEEVGMSYDIVLFRPRPGEDPLTTAHSEFGEMEQQVSPPDPAKESLKHRVASALMGENPLLEPIGFGYEEIAKFEGISVKDAKLKYRHIELNGPEDGNGIQIQLYDDEAYLSVPYWHEGAKAESTFQEIWKYLNIIQREAGYVAYDPQLDMILDLSRGYSEALNVYTGTHNAVMGQMPQAALKREERSQRKWWQFWK